jgi:hypothetical protein
MSEEGKPMDRDRNLLRTAAARVDGIEAVEDALRNNEEPRHLPVVQMMEARVVMDAEFNDAVAAQVEEVLSAQRRSEEEAKRAAEMQRGVEDEALRQCINAVLTTIRLQERAPILSRHDAATVRDMWERAIKIRKTAE